MRFTSNDGIDIPEDVRKRWQESLDILAELAEVPTALIDRLLGEVQEIEVFLASQSPSNPFPAGLRFGLHVGSYCERVMSRRQSLSVPNADAKEWGMNPAFKAGMVCYEGLPIFWPSGEVFGTLCLLDNREHRFSSHYRRLLTHFRDTIESDLRSLVFENERRDAEESQRKLRALVDYSSDFIGLADPDGRAIFVNEAGRKLVGLGSEEEVRTTRVIDYFGEEDRAYVDEVIFPELSRQNKWVGEFSFRHFKTGERIPVHYNVFAIRRPESGEVTAYATITRDISLEVRRREELTRAMCAAEAANKAKSQFIANMSHEIRTPMNAILGFADLLLEQPLAGEMQGYAERIRANGSHLLGLIDDILSFSKLEAGKVTTEKVGFSALSAVRDVVDLLMPLARRKGLKLNMQLGGGLPEHVWSDPLRFKQILINVIGNAIKFTDQGEVRISVRVEGHDGAPGGRLLAVEISDTGIGIPAEEQTRLFSPFRQVDTSISRRFEGTGLGLALSKRLAKLLGGDLELTSSRSGMGSCFTARIAVGVPVESAGHADPPLDGASADKVRAASRPKGRRREEGPLSGVHVLAVDDAADNQALVRVYLESQGACVELARDGIEAIEKAESGAHDIVLMDIQMPRLDGLEATRRLIRQGFVKPIIALTAHAMSEDVTRSLEAGCVAHLTKPIQKQKLVGSIIETLRNPIFSH